MRRLFVLLFALAALAPQPAHAASAPVSKSLYPTGSKFVIRAHASNGEVDCIWSDCATGQPIFHLTSQDELHRVSGWTQTSMRTKGGFIGFLMTSSVYESGSPENPDGYFAAQAYDDFVTATKALGFVEMKRQPHILSMLPTGMTGNERYMRINDKKWTLYVFVLQVGTHEIEALAQCRQHRGLGVEVLQDLIAQVQEALNLAMTGRRL